MTTPGPSIDETEDSLEFDLRLSLIDAARTEVFLGTFGHAIKEALLEALAREATPIFRSRIGGRYLPKRDEALRRKRDAAVMAAFTGRNHAEVMRQFQISRRLLFSIVSRASKRK